ncbi:DUF1353 domain-containing protein [Mesorhizobium sp. 43Arga]
MATKAIGAPVPVTPFADWDYFYTNASLEWRADNPVDGDCTYVRVPKWFVTDLASTPRIFWSLFPPAAAYSYPAIIHDYLYWFQPCSRKAADNVFRISMKELAVSPAKALMVYGAVRTAGFTAWQHNLNERSSGSRRVLKRVPSDMTITWKEWRLCEDVFDD